MRLVKFSMPEEVDEVLVFAEDESDEQLLELVKDTMGDDWVDADYETILTIDQPIPGVDTLRPFVG